MLLILWLLLYPRDDTPVLDYPQTLDAVAARHAALAAAWRADGADKAALTAQAETALTDAVAALYPHWYGTPWSYNGTTRVPGQGSIACGYFVTTLLADAGLRLPRIKMAQAPSERMIRALVGAAYVQRFSNVDITRFLEAVRARGVGLYVVGLDYHVGFLHVTDDAVWFVHSSFWEPSEVFRIKAEDSFDLRTSGYRVIGKLSDPALLEKWLTGRPVPFQP